MKLLLPSAFILVLIPALVAPALADDAQAAKDSTIVQTLLRLPNIDVNSKPKLREAVLRHLATKPRTAEYVDLVRRLKLKGVESQLLQMAVEDPEGNAGVQAAALLLKRGGGQMFADVLAGRDEALAHNAAKALGLVAAPDCVEFLRPIVTDSSKSRALRVTAASGLGRSREGQQYLLELVLAGKVTTDLRFAVANALHGSADPEIRSAAAKHLQLPAGADAEPLPPVARLLKMSGNSAHGAKLFRGKATCLKCHRTRGEGKEVGPDLSEIGTKLSREALYTSILDPSAGISHNYETYTAVLTDGNVVAGVLINRTSDAVTLRTAEAIDKRYAIGEIDELVKNQVSLMPADLQKLLSVQELVDVVEYLTTLKKVP